MISLARKDLNVMSPRRAGRLAGKTAIVTGGASGIGEASAKLFAQEGAAVLIADRYSDKGNEVQSAICAAGGRGEFLAANIAEPGEVERGVETAVRELGGLHVLFNNAGVHGAGATVEERWDDCLAVNLKAVYQACLAAQPHMQNAGGGSIVNTASISGPVVGFASPHYDASKGGIVGLTRNLASQWGQYGIRVNAICPGFVKTPFIGDWWTEDRLEAVKRDVALGRLGNPEEIAQVALFLASDGSSYVTGTAIVADGGWTTHFAKY